MSDLGNYIKEKRIQAGLSYKELSIMTGISDTSLQRMETGKTGMPRWENLCSIAKALGFLDYTDMRDRVRMQYCRKMLSVQALQRHFL